MDLTLDLISASADFAIPEPPLEQATVLTSEAPKTTNKRNTDDGYDEAVNSGFAPRTARSLKPGPWLSELCVHGRSFSGRCTNPKAKGWAHLGSVTEHSKATRDAYQFRASQATVVRVVPKLPEQQTYFVGTSGGGGSKKTAAVKHHPLVTQAELNAVYAAYRGSQSGLIGAPTSHLDVLTIVQTYIRGKAKKESNTFTARLQSREEDLVSEFILAAHKFITEMRCEGLFANYVNRSWFIHVGKSFELAKKERKLFQSVPDDKDKLRRFHKKLEGADFVSWQTYERDNTPSPGLGVSKLMGKQRTVAKMLLRGESQKAIAKNLNYSRHQVARIKKQIAKTITKGGDLV